MYESFRVLVGAIARLHERLAGHSADDRGELPAKVERVLDAGIRVMNLDRIRRVCRVACEKDAPDSEPARQARMRTKTCGSLESTSVMFGDSARRRCSSFGSTSASVVAVRK